MKFDLGDNAGLKVAGLVTTVAGVVVTVVGDVVAEKTLDLKVNSSVAEALSKLDFKEMFDKE